MTDFSILGELSLYGQLQDQKSLFAIQTNNSWESPVHEQFELDKLIHWKDLTQKKTKKGLFEVLKEWFSVVFHWRTTVMRVTILLKGYC